MIMFCMEPPYASVIVPFPTEEIASSGGVQQRLFLAQDNTPTAR